MEPILSIGITSYKRINELVRCIKSVDTKYVDDVEIIVSEDCSPLSKEIGEKVEELKEEIKYSLSFVPNEHNLGYDRNLAAIIQKSKGKYVFLISDDDAIYEGFLDILIQFLKKPNNDYGLLYSPFVYTSSKMTDRDHGKDMVIENGEKNCCKYVKDSILFSGLIFKRAYVKDLDAEPFLNMNYFQVYMFLKTMYHYGAYYFAHPSIWCVGDGENAYGLSESSGGNKDLQDRTSVISNLEFNRPLFKVIRAFDKEEGTNVFKDFERQYSLHSFSGLSIARRSGKQYFKDYWEKLNTLDIKLYPITKVYYWALFVFGPLLSDKQKLWIKKIVK